MARSHNDEMGQINANREFEDETLVSPTTLAKKSHDLEESQSGSFSEVQIEPQWRKKRFRSFEAVMFTTKSNLLMIFGPVAILVHVLFREQGFVFLFSLLGIIPLAERLGFVTEQLSYFTGSSVGGLLNATIGNATELIISIYAMKNKMLRVVQQSLLGSILSNTLFVVGCAFFSGGITFLNNKDQVFNKASASVGLGLLLMSVMCLLFPAVLHYTRTEINFGKSELFLSRFSSCVMLVAYGCYLIFQLKSHKSLYRSASEVRKHNEGSSETEGEETPEITKWEAILWLVILTVGISVLSDYLVDAIEGASLSWNVPVAFISVILLPIVGNASEHVSAVMFAMKDKLDISLGVAIGSSTQVAMFGIPFCVVVGWIMGLPMDLNFHIFETATLFSSILIVAFLVQDGTSNYFKGLMLIFCYLVVAAGFYVHKDPTKEVTAPSME